MSVLEEVFRLPTRLDSHDEHVRRTAMVGNRLLQHTGDMDDRLEVVETLLVILLQVMREEGTLYDDTGMVLSDGPITGYDQGGPFSNDSDMTVDLTTGIITVAHAGLYVCDVNAMGQPTGNNIDHYIGYRTRADAGSAWGADIGMGTALATNQVNDISIGGWDFVLLPAGAQIQFVYGTSSGIDSMLTTYITTRVKLEIPDFSEVAANYTIPNPNPSLHFRGDT